MLKIGCHLSTANGFLNMGKEIVALEAIHFNFFKKSTRRFRKKQLMKKILMILKNLQRKKALISF